LKFRNEQDQYLFLLEINRKDLLPTIGKPFEINAELYTSFIKGRQSLYQGIGLKSFRRSQSAKASWRANKYIMMKGISQFHKSTKGKQFHRKLNRFLTMKENLSPSESIAVVKALSSLKTRLLIEMEYYNSIDYDISLRLLLEEYNPVITSIENSILTNNKYNKEDLELLEVLLGCCDN